jgi:hypothetical protein
MAYTGGMTTETRRIFEMTFQLLMYRMNSRLSDWTLLTSTGDRFLSEAIVKAVTDLQTGVTNTLDTPVLGEAFDVWGNDLAINLNPSCRAILARRDKSIIIVMEGPMEEGHENYPDDYRLMCLHTGRLKPNAAGIRLFDEPFSREGKDVRRNLIAVLE